MKIDKKKYLKAIPVPAQYLHAGEVDIWVHFSKENKSDLLCLMRNICHELSLAEVMKNKFDTETWLAELNSDGDGTLS